MQHLIRLRCAQNVDRMPPPPSLAGCTTAAAPPARPTCSGAGSPVPCAASPSTRWCARSTSCSSLLVCMNCKVHAAPLDAARRRAACMASPALNAAACCNNLLLLRGHCPFHLFTMSAPKRAAFLQRCRESFNPRPVIRLPRLPAPQPNTTQERRQHGRERSAPPQRCLSRPLCAASRRPCANRAHLHAPAAARRAPSSLAQRRPTAAAPCREGPTAAPARLPAARRSPATTLPPCSPWCTRPPAVLRLLR